MACEAKNSPGTYCKGNTCCEISWKAEQTHTPSKLWKARGCSSGKTAYKGRRLSARLKGRKGKAFLTVTAAEKPPASFLSIEAFATIRKFQTVSRIKISCLVTPRSARQRQLNPSWLSCIRTGQASSHYETHSLQLMDSTIRTGPFQLEIPCFQEYYKSRDCKNKFKNLK